MMSRKWISSTAKDTRQPIDIPRPEKVPMAFICMFWTSTEAVVATCMVGYKTTQPVISITTSPSPLTMWTRCKLSSIWATTSLWSSGSTMPSGPVLVQAWEIEPPSLFANGDILANGCQWKLPSFEKFSTFTLESPSPLVRIWHSRPPASSRRFARISSATSPSPTMIKQQSFRCCESLQPGMASQKKVSALGWPVFLGPENVAQPPF